MFDKNSFRSYTHGMIIGQELGSRKRVLEGRRKFYEYRAQASKQAINNQVKHHKQRKSFNWP